MASYDTKGIKGEQLATTMQAAASEIKKKQDIIDAKYDAANATLVLKNVSIEVSST
jgi:hypothetical protein